jgi:uncharacterized surface protein with fasciclin (FAS1) repeats
MIQVVEYIIDMAKVRSSLLRHRFDKRFSGTKRRLNNVEEAETVSGIKVPVEVKMDSVYVGGAKVVTADIIASNGVIHVIDTVMLPAAN